MSQRNPRVSLSERSLRRHTAAILQEYAQPVQHNNATMGMIVLKAYSLRKKIGLTSIFVNIYRYFTPFIISEC